MYDIKVMKKGIVIFIVLVATGLLGELFAQCPMCRMSLESNLENGGTAGKTINTGILYMLMVPYIIVATLGYIWYKRNKRPGDLVRDVQKTIPQT